MYSRVIQFYFKKSISQIIVTIKLRFQTAFKNNSRCVLISPYKIKTKVSSLLEIDVGDNNFTLNMKSAFALMRHGTVDEKVALHIRNVSFIKNFGPFIKLSYINNKKQKLDLLFSGESFSRVYFSV